MPAVDFTPFPTLQTKRLILREMTLSDQEALYVLRSNAAIMRFIPRPPAQTVTDAAALIEDFRAGVAANERITWGIALPHLSRIVGTIGFVRMQPEHARAEVGYLLHPDYRGQGLVQEALRAVLAYGFETLKLHSIVAVVDPANTPSARVLERAGFRKEGHFRENIRFGARFLDSVYYARLATDPAVE
ncbi:GNAT family N-acetyltransferase [Larkinella sp. VNQ87]|uniref:GNAT family N-acetyltransferase n=1 Tax=Larkinella sp. VNQ87 TaxID=3400921 RepID=UPI003C0492EC